MKPRELKSKLIESRKKSRHFFKKERHRPSLQPLYSEKLGVNLHLFGPIYKNKDKVIIYFISPPPSPPSRGEETNIPPLVGGIEDGG
jgi:hypothetical protein